MHLPLGIAFLPLLTLVLLPLLDRSVVRSEINARDLRIYLNRIARWVKE